MMKFKLILLLAVSYWYWVVKTEAYSIEDNIQVKSDSSQNSATEYFGSSASSTTVGRIYARQLSTHTGSAGNNEQSNLIIETTNSEQNGLNDHSVTDMKHSGVKKMLPPPKAQSDSSNKEEQNERMNTPNRIPYGKIGQTKPSQTVSKSMERHIQKTAGSNDHSISEASITNPVKSPSASRVGDLQSNVLEVLPLESTETMNSYGQKESIENDEHWIEQEPNYAGTGPRTAVNQLLERQSERNQIEPKILKDGDVTYTTERESLWLEMKTSSSFEIQNTQTGPKKISYPSHVQPYATGDPNFKPSRPMTANEETASELALLRKDEQTNLKSFQENNSTSSVLVGGSIGSDKLTLLARETTIYDVNNYTVNNSVIDRQGGEYLHPSDQKDSFGSRPGSTSQAYLMGVQSDVDPLTITYRDLLSGPTSGSYSASSPVINKETNTNSSTPIVTTAVSGSTPTQPFSGSSFVAGNSASIGKGFLRGSAEVGRVGEEGIEVAKCRPLPPQEKHLRPAWISSFPGSGSKLTWQLIEGITGLFTGDDYDSSGRGAKGVAVAIKTHYPSHTEERVFRQRIFDGISRTLLVLRNPTDAFPALFRFVYYIEQKKARTSGSSQPPVQAWVTWRDENFGMEVKAWVAHAQWWLDNFERENLHLLPFEYLTSPQRGSDELQKIGNFLGSADQTIASSLVAPEQFCCIWDLLVKHNDGLDTDRVETNNKLENSPYTPEQLEYLLQALVKLRDNNKSFPEFVQLMNEYLGDIVERKKLSSRIQ